MRYPYDFLEDNERKKNQIQIFDRWVRDNKITKQIEKSYWTNLLPGSKRHMKKDAIDWGYYPKIYGNKPPYDDHFLLFKDVHGDRVYVYQPYNCNQEKILSWAEKKGISVMFYDKKYSWYYNNNTYLIELRIKDSIKFKEYLRKPFCREEYIN